LQRSKGVERKGGTKRKVVCSACNVRDAVKERIKKNEKGEIFCLPCRTGKKTPWWNWGGKLE